MTFTTVQTNNLTRTYRDILAVDRLNLTVPNHSIYAFLGPNGAGKTTTIRMLLGLIRPDSGTIHLFGQPLHQHRHTLLARLGTLVEAPSLYPHLTGHENLEVTRRILGIDKTRIPQVLDTVGLTHAAHRPTRTYSQGMRQRLGLALALLNQPELLILDEPTNGLDPAGIQEMRHLIRRLPAEYNTTVFLSSHLLSEVEQIATHVGIIFGGKLQYSGTLEDLQNQRQKRILIGVDRPQAAANLLTQAGWPVENHSDTLSVQANDTTSAAQINNLLVQAGLAVHHLQLHQPSLENLFLHLTHNTTPPDQHQP